MLNIGLFFGENNLEIKLFNIGLIVFVIGVWLGLSDFRLYELVVREIILYF